MFVDEDALCQQLERIVGAGRLSRSDVDRDTYARDMWPRLLLGLRDDRAVTRPRVVVWPASEREITAIIRLANKLKVPVIPYGGGSGVCGGTVPTQPCITIDVKRLDKLRSITRDDMECDVEAGIIGERFERELNARGYTLGHFPSSIYCSTVGGWLATRAAGQMSTKYGKIEDRVVGLTFVTGSGELMTTDGLARVERGPNWTQTLVGSEGTLGIITSARLRLMPNPPLRILRGFHCEDVEHGIACIHRVMRRGLRPAVVRLYDEFDTLLHKYSSGESTAVDPTMAPRPQPSQGALPKLRLDDSPAMLQRLLSRIGKTADRMPSLRHLLRGETLGALLTQSNLINRVADTVIDPLTNTGCRLIIGLEGARIRTGIEAKLVFQELEAAGARDDGEEPGHNWFAHRYSVSYKMSPVFRKGAFVDTMEVATTWEHLAELYDEVREAIGKYAVVLAHFSHAYQEGCSIYFTFAAQASDTDSSIRLYDQIWKDGMEATLRVGGTISHHHGVGLLKARYVTREHRQGMHVMQALKDVLDPNHVMNPGKLGFKV